MKYFYLSLILFLPLTCFSQHHINYNLILTNDFSTGVISLLDFAKEDTIWLLNIDKTKSWQIDKVELKDNFFMFLIFREYYDKEAKKEKIEINQYKYIFNHSSNVNLIDSITISKIDIDSNITLQNSLLKSLFQQDVILADSYGNIIYNNENILNNSKSKKNIIFSYSDPELSKNGQTILCTFEKSKYSRKNRISSELIEYDLSAKQFLYHNLSGVCPTYSNDESKILYLDKCGNWIVYDKIIQMPIYQFKSSQAIWIK